MADEKISAMPASAAGVADPTTAVLPLVAFGANFQVTINDLLTAGAFSRQFLGGAGGLGIAGDGTIDITGTVGKPVSIFDGFAMTNITFDGGGNLTLNVENGKQFLVLCSGNAITIDTFGFITVGLSGANVNVGYGVGTPGDWLGAAPGYANQALDRIAAALNILLGGGGIP